MGIQEGSMEPNEEAIKVEHLHSNPVELPGKTTGLDKTLTKQPVGLEQSFAIEETPAEDSTIVTPVEETPAKDSNIVTAVEQEAPTKVEDVTADREPVAVPEVSDEISNGGLNSGNQVVTDSEEVGEAITDKVSKEVTPTTERVGGLDKEAVPEPIEDSTGDEGTSETVSEEAPREASVRNESESAFSHGIIPEEEGTADVQEEAKDVDSAVKQDEVDAAEQTPKDAAAADQDIPKEDGKTTEPAAIKDVDLLVKEDNVDVEGHAVDEETATSPRSKPEGERNNKIVEEAKADNVIVDSPLEDSTTNEDEVQPEDLPVQSTDEEAEQSGAGIQGASSKVADGSVETLTEDIQEESGESKEEPVRDTENRELDVPQSTEPVDSDESVKADPKEEQVPGVPTEAVLEGTAEDETHTNVEDKVENTEEIPELTSGETQHVVVPEEVQETSTDGESKPGLEEAGTGENQESVEGIQNPTQGENVEEAREVSLEDMAKEDHETAHVPEDFEVADGTTQTQQVVEEKDAVTEDGEAQVELPREENVHEPVLGDEQVEDKGRQESVTETGIHEDEEHTTEKSIEGDLHEPVRENAPADIAPEKDPDVEGDATQPDEHEAQLAEEAIADKQPGINKEAAAADKSSSVGIHEPAEEKVEESRNVVKTDLIDPQVATPSEENKAAEEHSIEQVSEHADEPQLDSLDIASEEDPEKLVSDAKQPDEHEAHATKEALEDKELDINREVEQDRREPKVEESQGGEQNTTKTDLVDPQVATPREENKAAEEHSTEENLAEVINRDLSEENLGGETQLDKPEPVEKVQAEGEKHEPVEAQDDLHEYEQSKEEGKNSSEPQAQETENLAQDNEAARELTTVAKGVDEQTEDGLSIDAEKGSEEVQPKEEEVEDNVQEERETTEKQKTVKEAEDEVQKATDEDKAKAISPEEPNEKQAQISTTQPENSSTEGSERQLKEVKEVPITVDEPAEIFPTQEEPAEDVSLKEIPANVSHEQAENSPTQPEIEGANQEQLDKVEEVPSTMDEQAPTKENAEHMEAEEPKEVSPEETSEEQVSTTKEPNLVSEQAENSPQEEQAEADNSPQEKTAEHAEEQAVAENAPEELKEKGEHAEGIDIEEPSKVTNEQDNKVVPLELEQTEHGLERAPETKETGETQGPTETEVNVEQASELKEPKEPSVVDKQVENIIEEEKEMNISPREAQDEAAPSTEDEQETVENTMHTDDEDAASTIHERAENNNEKGSTKLSQAASLIGNVPMALKNMVTAAASAVAKGRTTKPSKKKRLRMKKELAKAMQQQEQAVM